MIKIRCKRCKRIFELDLTNRKGRWVIPLYCNTCKDKKDTTTSRYKNTTNFMQDKELFSNKKREQFIKIWIIDETNIPNCTNCGMHICDEQKQILSSNDIYDIYYNNKKDYELKNAEKSILTYDDKNIICDYNHGIMHCKQCGLVIGYLEVYGTEDIDYWNI